MRTRAELLAARRQRLIAECVMQRADLALQIEPLTHTMNSVEVGLRIVDRVRQHPGWIAAAVVGLMAIRPRRLSSFLRLGSAGLRTWRMLRPSLQLLLPG
ncbi:YqjK family protein [Noviherbaspirillum sp.]|jgi:hypothetical protein|uniref:YqjK family protein n=1 Tax=Noviherbaspirillum sp. TaxID=1926288 RepID=UPI0025DB7E80|nr:YqjK family protein [Noviherbaspirillum sp.]